MQKLVPIIAVVSAGILGAVSPQPAKADIVFAERPATIARDSGDSLFRRARIALADGDYERAAELFGQVRAKYAKTSLGADAYYWEAFAISRDASRVHLRRAVQLLEEQARNYASASTVKSGEARTLNTRLKGLLARGGDAEAAVAVVENAASASSPAVSAGVAVAVGGGVSGGVARVDATAPASAGAARAGDAAREAARAASRAQAEADRAQSRVVRDSYGLTIADGGRGRRGNVPPGCKDEDEDDRIEALNALLQMNADQALPILKKVLERRDQCSELLRRKAVFLISQKRTEETADLLLKAARNDPDDETRSQAIFWLSQVAGDKAEDFLVSIVRESKNAEEQERALFSLGQRKSDRAQQAVRDFASRADSPPALRKQALFWIGQRRTEENAKFLRETFAKVNDEESREAIIVALAQMRGLGNESFILEQVSNAKLSLDTRKQALFWASQQGMVTTAQLGGMYAKSDDQDMREQIIFSLSQRGNKDAAAVDKLLEIAKTEKNAELRKRAIFWLGQSKDPRAAKLLQELIDR